MRYYQISKNLALRLGVTTFRVGNEKLGYIVTSGDLAAIGIDVAVKEYGAVELDEKQARKLYKNIMV